MVGSFGNGFSPVGLGLASTPPLHSALTGRRRR